MSSQAKTNTNSGSVRVYHRVIVDLTVVAKSDWGVVSLVNTKEYVDWLYSRKKEEHYKERGGKSKSENERERGYIDRVIESER